MAAVADDTLTYIGSDSLTIATSDVGADMTGGLDEPFEQVNNAITAGHYVLSFYIKENVEVYATRSWNVYVYFGNSMVGEFTIT